MVLITKFNLITELQIYSFVRFSITVSIQYGPHIGGSVWWHYLLYGPYCTWYSEKNVLYMMRRWDRIRRKKKSQVSYFGKQNGENTVNQRRQRGMETTAVRAIGHQVRGQYGSPPRAGRQIRTMCSCWAVHRGAAEVDSLGSLSRAVQERWCVPLSAVERPAS
jgi:hypothetical protein